MKYRGLSLVTAGALIGGCATTIVPPAHVQTPAKVYLVDQGRTSSLVIPNESGGATRYAYGDWDWYAMRKTGPLHAIAALCWPTQGALGRQQLQAVPDAQAVVKQMPYPPENVYEIVLEREKVLAVGRELDGVFVTAAGTYHNQPAVGLEFVHYPEAYTAAHNSNHMTAKWLQEMGAKTHGWPVLSVWKVEQSKAQ